MLTGKDPEPLAVASPKSVNPVVSDVLDALVSDLMRINLKDRIPSIAEASSRLSVVGRLDQ